MNSGRLIFSQLMDFLPMHEFRKCVERYEGNKRVRSFSCLHQFFCMAFAQLTYRESLRDIETCLKAIPKKHYHMGYQRKHCKKYHCGSQRKKRLAHLCRFRSDTDPQAEELYAEDDFGLELDETVYALDSTTIDLWLNYFHGQLFAKRKPQSKCIPCLI